jgi:hypothetical protein
MRSKLQGIKALGHFYNKSMNLFSNEARGMGQGGNVVIWHGVMRQCGNMAWGNDVMWLFGMG